MKKFFLIMAVVAITCMTALTSCKKSNADLIKEYEGLCKELVTATQNGDFEKVASLSEKGQELEKELSERELTDEEQSQLLEIQATAASEIVGSAAAGIGDVLESASEAAEEIEDVVSIPDVAE